VRRRVSVFGTMVLLVVATTAAGAPAAFAGDGGCREGQEQAFYNAWTKHEDEEQTAKHLDKMIDCTVGHPPGEGQ
jgi:hypothetical protein